MPINALGCSMKHPLLFLSLIACAGSLFAREPVWVFNNGPDTKLLSLGQGQLHREVGLTKLIPTGTDLTLTVPMGEEDAFPADKRPFFAVRYKYQTTITQASTESVPDSRPAVTWIPFPFLSLIGGS